MRRLLFLAAWWAVTLPGCPDTGTHAPPGPDDDDTVSDDDDTGTSDDDDIGTDDDDLPEPQHMDPCADGVC